jgi:hypothetical protein
MKTYGGLEVYIHVFLTSALYPLERTFRTHLIGGWVGLRAGLHSVAERKKSLPLLRIESRLFSPLLSHCTD